MTLPEGVQPSGPTSDEPTVAEEPLVTETVTTDDASTAEDASDADLRAWAKDNGIEGVPASGKLSAAWREQIVDAMAEKLDPKEEDSAGTTSTESSTSVETKTGEEPLSGEKDSSSEPEKEVAEEPEVVQPEREPTEYRSVYKAPNTFVSSQAFTA